jgi:6-phosphogluconolactonase (cycloisomerase 2 family)
MEMNERMARRFWLLGLLGLVVAGLLVACTNYNPSTDGLVVVGSQGSALLQSFSFNLNTGAVYAVTNPTYNTADETCVLNGSPANMVMTPTGTYTYVIFNKSDQCSNATQFGIATFQVNSDGSIAQVGNLVPDPNPIALAMDPAGKYLFVAEGISTTPCTQSQNVYGVCVYAIGSGGSLTAVQSSYVFPPFPTPPNFTALAASPTVFPNVGINGTQNSVCSIPGSTPPTAQYLYLVDAANYQVLEFAVNTSTGALGNPGVNPSQVFTFPTDKVPMGVAVDPCDRFVYVSDMLTNKVSGYLLCSVVILNSNAPCPYADGSLFPVPGSPFTMAGSAESPGPILVDPYGNNVYVLGTLSDTVSPFKISPVSGALSALTPPTVATGQGPVSMTIRQDDNWLFVANFGTGALGGNTVSQYSVTPATGALTVLPAIQTDNQPFGVAVK